MESELGLPVWRVAVWPGEVRLRRGERVHARARFRRGAGERAASPFPLVGEEERCLWPAVGRPAGNGEREEDVCIVSVGGVEVEWSGGRAISSSFRARMD